MNVAGARTTPGTVQPQASTDRAERLVVGEPAVPGLAPAPVRLSSAQWERATQDPFVLRVKEAVDGTLLDVRPAHLPGEVNPGNEKRDDTDEIRNDRA